MAFWSATHDPNSMKMFAYHLCYILVGCFRLCQEWLATGMKETPEKMAGLSERLILDGSTALE